MIASKPNPQLRFYNQNKSTSRQKTWLAIENALKNESCIMKQCPDYQAEHRKFIMSDYHKKIEEIKHLK